MIDSTRTITSIPCLVPLFVFVHRCRFASFLPLWLLSSFFLSSRSSSDPRLRRPRPVPIGSACRGRRWKLCIGGSARGVRLNWRWCYAFEGERRDMQPSVAEVSNESR